MLKVDLRASNIITKSKILGISKHLAVKYCLATILQISNLKTLRLTQTPNSLLN
jgi:hypothetical protein